MPTLDEIRIDLEGIAHVLADNRLRVPIFQRSYAWEAMNVTDLLRDIAGAVGSGANEYFLGSVVVSTEHSGILEVVDGQQRLATVAIIIAQIRNYLLSIGERERANTLETDYLLKRDLRTQEALPRLTLNDSDHDFFQKAILSQPQGSTVAPNRKSHRLLLEARGAAQKHIDAITSTARRPIEALIDYIDYLHDRAKIILVRVPNHANAFTIFETLNDRGIDLAISDLLKNYLFYQADNRIAEAQAAWSSMTGALAAVDPDTSAVDYIRHFWSSSHGATRERDLYANIRRKTSSKQAAIDLATGLEVAGRHYAAILSPGHEFWSDYGQSARQHIATINLLRMVQVRPLLLALVEHFSVQEARKALRLVVSWGVRFLVHGGLGGGTLEDHYCQRAQEIRSGGISTAADLSRAMAPVVPSDAAFESAFSTASVAQAYLARYYLRGSGAPGSR